MLNHFITDGRAWNTESFPHQNEWYCELTAINEVATKDILESGRGFLIFKRLQNKYDSIEEKRKTYWSLAQTLGAPCEQNIQGTILYDVMDTGQSVADGARFSVTNQACHFHTDNMFGETLIDFIGLLCLQTAKSGGMSKLLSAYSVHNELLLHHPDILPTLYKPFHVEKRGGVRPGEEPTIQVPVFAWDGENLTTRYLRYWIEAGHRTAQKPLTRPQIHALDILDKVLDNPKLQICFYLKEGEILFCNNRTTLHSRTAFTDHDDKVLHRHYLRYWGKFAPSKSTGQPIF